MSKTKAMKFTDLPTSYAELAAIYMPRPLHDADEYEAALAVCYVLAGNEHRMTRDQDDYLDAVTTFVEKYEDAHPETDIDTSDVTGLDVLRDLVERHGLRAIDVSEILGMSTMVGPMILRGERNITAGHARALGKHFNLDPGVFIRE